MSESDIQLRPQISLSAEGLLEIVTEYDDDEEMAAKQDVIIDRLLEDNWGLENHLSEDDVVILSADVERSFRRSSFIHSAEERDRLDNFLVSLSHLLPYDPEDYIDRVFALKSMNYLGPYGVVYPQLQRWLDNQGMSEAVSRRTKAVMALPFGDTIPSHFEVSLMDGPSSEFHFSRSEESDQGWSIQSGDVNWKWLNLKTFGECACFGVTGEDRSKLHFDDNRRNLSLYEMKPHNITRPHQTLSLVLGMAALAHEAYEYVGNQEVFSNARLDETVEYQPKFFSS